MLGLPCDTVLFIQADSLRLDIFSFNVRKFVDFIDQEFIDSTLIPFSRRLSARYLIVRYLMLFSLTKELQ